MTAPLSLYAGILYEIVSSARDTPLRMAPRTRARIARTVAGCEAMYSSTVAIRAATSGQKSHDEQHDTNRAGEQAEVPDRLDASERGDGADGDGHLNERDRVFKILLFAELGS